MVHPGRPFWFARGVALHPSALPHAPLTSYLTLILGSCLFQLQILEQSNLSLQHRWSLWQGEREVRLLCERQGAPLPCGKTHG